MQEIRCNNCRKIIGQVDWGKQILVLQCPHNIRDNGKNKNCNTKNEIKLKP